MLIQICVIMARKLLTNVNVIWLWVTVVFIILQINVFCAADCPPNPKYSNKLEHSKDLLTTLVSGSASEGSKAKLSCAIRHYLDGPNTIECTNNKWVANSDDTNLRCAAIKCDNPHKIKLENGRINTFVLPGLNRSSGHYLQDSVYWVTCDKGFILKGNPVRRCMWNGTYSVWSQPADIYGEKILQGGDSPPTCEEDPNYIQYSCPDPHGLIIENGKINTFNISDHSSKDYLKDSIFWVTCDNGFKLKGYPVRRCLWNDTHGIWSRPADIYGEKLFKGGDSPPQCVPDQNFKNYSDRKNHFKVIEIIMWIFVVCYLIGFIGTAGVTCYKTIPKIKHDLQSDKKCKAKSVSVCKYFWKGLILSLFYFLSPMIHSMILLYKTCKGFSKEYTPSEKTRNANSGDELIEEENPLQSENDRPDAMENNQNLTQSQQLLSENRQMTQSINELIQKHGNLIQNIQKLMPINPDLAPENSASGNQGLVIETGETELIPKPIDELTSKHQKLSGQIEGLIKFMTREANWEDQYNVLEKKYAELKKKHDSLKSDNMEHKKSIQKLEEKCESLDDKQKLKTGEDEEMLKLQKENQELKQTQKEDKLKQEHGLAQIDLENKLATEKGKNVQLDKDMNHIKKKHLSNLKLIKVQIDSIVNDLKKPIDHAKDTGQDIALTLTEVKGTLVNLNKHFIEREIASEEDSLQNEAGAFGVSGRQ